MKKIIVITTPGAMKRDFVDVLSAETDGAVALVVVQKPKPVSIWKRFTKFYCKVGIVGVVPELWYALRLRNSKRLREAITITKSRSPIPNLPDRYVPPIFETSDINSVEVAERLRALQPDVLAIWGGSIIRPHIIETAKKVVNIHTGYCPYYRGTNCNLNAILNNDVEHIGITLHAVVPAVDAGDIYTIIQTNTEQSYRQMFVELNDRAFAAYIDLIKRLLSGEQVTLYPQDITKGKNYLLKEWTYQKQYLVAKKIIEHDAAIPAMVGRQ